jgi:secreted PhoX family phosphatase
MATTMGRRGFLRSGALGVTGVALAGPLAPLGGLAGCQPRPPLPGNGYGPIAPVADRTTGLPLLKLPDGFSYQSFGWTGDLMDDGTPTPDRHDGMAVVESRRGGRGHGRHGGDDLVLIRNHERGPILAGQPLPIVGAGEAPVYDGFQVPGTLDGLGGGTTALFFSGGRWTGSQATLGGTLVNCCGGPTPWGSWLTCEELMLKGTLAGAKDHGFVYEVPSPRRSPASAVAIEGMGLMKHEAAAVDPETGDVFLTEDNGPHSGLYRFRPHRRARRVGDLEGGGRLEMLKVVGVDNADLRNPTTGQRFEVEWVPIADPTADPETFVSPGLGFPAILGAGRSGPFLQGEALGAARFDRGEGCSYADGVVYAVDTGAGPIGKGAVWALRIGRGHRRSTLTAVFVSQSEEAADNLDNITVSPRGGLLVCEDGSGLVVDGTRRFGTRLIGLNRRGGSFVFAENAISLDAAIPGKPAIVPGDHRGNEFAGATFSPSGRYLFVNVQQPGVTFAIEGPWRRGVL